MKAIRKNLQRYILLILPLAAVLMGMVLMALQQPISVQSFMAVPMPQSFLGEYSYDGENWHPLDREADLSAKNPDLYLRGHFEMEVYQDSRLYFYGDHIGTEISVNGQLMEQDIILELARHGIENQPSTCCREWKFHYFPQDVFPDDLVEIHIRNPHSFGNKNAYNTFLNTLCCTPNEPDFLATTLAPEAYPYNIIGILLTIAGVLLLCCALVCLFLRYPLDISVVQTGLLAVFAGAFFLLDTVDICFKITDHIVSTCSWQICLMYSVHLLRIMAKDLLEGKRKIIAGWVLAIGAGFDICAILVSFGGLVLIYDTLPYWVMVQWICLLVLISCCIWEILTGSRNKRPELIVYVLIFVAILLDSLGLQDSIYSSCMLSKGAVLLFFLLKLFQFVRSMIHNFKASSRAIKLEKELEESRIAMMLSQIQPHFIFNVLGTIRGLCREDPDRAWRALGDFSAYLRANMNALTNTNFIPFAMELSHIEAYLRLEQMRMGQRLNVVYDIQEKGFSIPPLMLQPLVENAVKHGLFYKEEGGTVTIRSVRKGNEILLSVLDDGIGFEAAAREDDFHQRQHNGLENVRFRVEKMLGGKLLVDSNRQQGAEVTVQFTLEDLS